MRQLCIMMLIAAFAPAISLANESPATTAPDTRSRIGSLVANLFSQTRQQQQQTREHLEGQADLPAILAALLCHDDSDIRRTSLLLLRDDYGDWAIVAAVQTMLQSELARGPSGDAYIIAACCEILSDWPQWDSIPVLLDAVRCEHQVAGVPAPDGAAEPSRVAVWRLADAALRLISGEWPNPEPDAASPVEPNSSQDLADRKSLAKSWGEWWAVCLADNQPLPQLRMELTWASHPTARPSGRAADLEVAIALMWLRPNGNVYFSRTIGLADGLDVPMWRWDERVARHCQTQMNAIQADAARALANDVAAAGPGTTWAISRPAGLPLAWQGRLQVISPFGICVGVGLAEPGTDGAVRPPSSAIEALSELLAIPMP